MSLVNDALNRARAEAAEERDREQGRQPLPASHPRREPSRGVPIWVIPTIVALAVLATLLWRYSGTTTSPDTEPVEKDGAVAMGAGPAPTEPPPSDPAGTPHRSQAQTAATPPSSTAPGPPRPGADPPRPSNTPPAEAPAVEPPPRSIAATSPTTIAIDDNEDETWYYVGAITLPGGGSIELGGIAWTPTAPSAILNGTLLSVGGEVLGLRVAAISERTVVLEGRGRRYALQLGAAARDEAE